eukprot:g1684.t1
MVNNFNSWLCLLLATATASASASTPPTFANEYALNYTVTNMQYGFKVLGRWTVDHGNLRERTDSYNLTMQPRAEIKTFPDGLDARYDDVRDVWSCGNTRGTQPAFALPPNASLVGETASPPQQRWRVFHADNHVCVDFFVGFTVAGGAIRQAPLPSSIVYYGNCLSATAVDADTETMAQNNSYYGFDVSTPCASLFELPAACGNETEATASTAGIASRSLSLPMDLFGRQVSGGSF